MNESEIWNELGNIYLKIGSYDDAIVMYDKSIKLDRESGWTYSNLALAFCHKGKYSDAVLLYQKSIALLDNDQEKGISWKRLGDAYRQLNDHNQSMAAYQKAEEILAVFPVIGDNQVVSDSDQPSKARPISEEEPGDELPPNGRERYIPDCLEESEYYDLRTHKNQNSETRSSIFEEDISIAQDPQQNALEPSENTELLDLSSPESNSLPVEQSFPPDVPELEKPSRFMFLMNGISTEYIQDKNTELQKGMQDVFDQCRSIHSEINDCEQPTRSGKEKIVDGSHNTMDSIPVTVTEDAGVYSGSHSKSTSVLHELHQRTCNLDESIAFYKKITDATPTNDAAWDALGNIYRTLGCYGEAISAFEQAISLQPSKEEYHYHLGLAHAAQKHNDEAIKAFQQVIELNPEYMLAHGALAGSFRRLGLEDEATEHIRIALPLMQNEKEYNRACFEAICGNVDKAIELLEVALERKQTPLEWVRCDPDLDSVRDDPRFRALVDEGSYDAKTKARISLLCSSDNLTHAAGY